MVLSAITICSFVIVPATIEDASGEAAMLAAKPVAPESIVAVADTPARLVDYVAIHEQALISAGCTTAGAQRSAQDDPDADSSLRLFCAPTMRLR